MDKPTSNHLISQAYSEQELSLEEVGLLWLLRWDSNKIGLLTTTLQLLSSKHGISKSTLQRKLLKFEKLGLIKYKSTSKHIRIQINGKQ